MSICLRNLTSSLGPLSWGIWVIMEERGTERHPGHVIANLDLCYLETELSAP